MVRTLSSLWKAMTNDRVHHLVWEKLVEIHPLYVKRRRRLRMGFYTGGKLGLQLFSFCSNQQVQILSYKQLAQSSTSGLH